MGFVVDVEPAAFVIDCLRETGEKLLTSIGRQHPMVRSRAQEVEIGRGLMPPDPRIASVLEPTRDPYSQAVIVTLDLDRSA
jgi:hypothetical protein